jgi:hypothetical protein
MARPRLGGRTGRSMPVRFGAVVRKRAIAERSTVAIRQRVDRVCGSALQLLGGERRCSRRGPDRSRARSTAPAGISRPYRARLQSSRPVFSSQVRGARSAATAALTVALFSSDGKRRAADGGQKYMQAAFLLLLSPPIALQRSHSAVSLTVSALSDA